MLHPRSRSRLSILAVLAVLTALASGCGSESAPSLLPAGHQRRPTAPPVATVQVGFDVAVTPPPTIAVRSHPPRPTPTRFVAPRGPYIVLQPNVGPPIIRSITVRGGNLPPSTALDLVWSPGRATSGVSRTAYTDARGGLRASLSIPGSPPGPYQVTAQFSGATLAAARYTVRSPATVSVSVSTASAGLDVRIEGRKFLPHLRLELIVYPMTTRSKPLYLGNAETGRTGSFLSTLTTTALPPGEYVLRAWSASMISAQMAETFFQVVI